MTDYGTIYNSGGFFSRKNREKWGRNGEEPRNLSVKMAERGGFEPPEGCPSSVFKTDALNRSTISPHESAGKTDFGVNKILEKREKSRLGKKKRGNKPERYLKTSKRGDRIKTDNHSEKHIGMKQSATFLSLCLRAAGHKYSGGVFARLHFEHKRTETSHEQHRTHRNSLEDRKGIL